MCCLKCILINHIVAHSRELCWCSSMNILPSFLSGLAFSSWVVFLPALYSWFYCIGVSGWSNHIFHTNFPLSAPKIPAFFCLSLRFSIKNRCIFSFPGEKILNISPGAAVLYSQSLSAGSGLGPSFLSAACASCLSHLWHFWCCLFMRSRRAPPCVWRLSCLFLYPLFLFEKVLVLFHPILI